MNKKKTKSIHKSSDRIYGLAALILAFISAFFATRVFIPLGITLFALFVILTIVFFTRTSKR